MWGILFLSGATPTTITLDGNIDPTEWSGARILKDLPADSTWNSLYNEIKAIYATWDSQYLYIGVWGYTATVSDGTPSSLLIYLDTDPSTGAYDLSNIDHWDRNVSFVGGKFAPDFEYGSYAMQAGSLFKINSPTSSDQVVFGFADAVGDKTVLTYPGWELKIAWNTLYGLGDNAVPRNCYIKILVTIAGGNDNEDAGGDCAPNQKSVDFPYFDNYAIIVVDADGDGVPDSGIDPEDQPPVVYSMSVTPLGVSAGDLIKFKLKVEDAGDGISDVTADLTGLGLGVVSLTSNSDGTEWTGEYTVASISADTDVAFNLYPVTGTRISVYKVRVYKTETLRVVEDKTEDDYGPGSYVYPQATVYNPDTESYEQVFVDGCFDITKVEIGYSPAVLTVKVFLRELKNPGWNSETNFDVQKIDVYIDTDDEASGSTILLTGRNAVFQAKDSWNWVAVADGWYRGLLDSSLSEYDAVVAYGDEDRNLICIAIDLSYLGNPTKDQVKNWDILVAMMGHGDQYSQVDYGYVRTVKESTADWEFGGGDDGESDSNIIDYVAIPGAGKQPGRPQEECLDWEKGVRIDIEKFVDVTPPVLSNPFGSLSSIQTAGELLMPLRVVDESSLSFVKIHYRQQGAASFNTVDMEGPDGRDFYFAWIPVSGITVLEYYFEAQDSWGNHAVMPATGYYTLALVKSDEGAMELIPNFTQDDRSYVYTPFGVIVSWRLNPFSAGSLTLKIKKLEHYYQPVPSYFEELNYVYEIKIEKDGLYVKDLANPLRIGIWSPSGSNKIVARWESKTRRWVETPGFCENYWTFGETSSLSTFGVFGDKRKSVSKGAILSVKISPNPFSPNGDGIYDKASIYVNLSEKVTLSVEIFDSRGNLVKAIYDEKEVNPDEVEAFFWDGKDSKGREVPAGLYFVRVHAVKGEDGWRIVKPVVLLR